MRPLFLINFEGMPFQITGELTWLIAGKVNTALIMNFALVLLVILRTPVDLPDNCRGDRHWLTLLLFYSIVSFKMEASIKSGLGDVMITPGHTSGAS